MNFTKYMMSFYGEGGIYDHGFTPAEINLATQLYKCRLADYGQAEFEGDSLDRERIRDIIFHYRGAVVLEHPLPEAV